MKFDKKTPRASRTISGQTVSLIAPYAEGHVVTEAEASMLNQTLAENIGNNLRQTIKDGPVDADGKPTGEAWTPEALQALVDEYTAGYEPGVRSGGGGGRVTDPVEREARKIAREKVAAAVKAKGYKQADVDMTALVDKFFAANEDALRTEAAKIVEVRNAASNAADDIDLGLDIAKVEQTEG